MTNRGFADEIEIARQARPSLYDAHVDRSAPLVDRELRVEVTGRLDAAGRELEPFDGHVADIDAAVDAVAVCLLHADLDASHEDAVAAVLSARGLDVTLSSAVSPEFREYERMVTTVANAGAATGVPRVSPRPRTTSPTNALVMTSAGGLVPVGDAADLPVTLLLSGPAGGVRAAAEVATCVWVPHAVSFDMGGTSTDVCLVRGGVPEPSPSRVVAGYAIRMPALAVHTIGAGGGSVARIDAGGALVVGPESAGAVPGPACYGRGGTRPTVTDADLVLGRIGPDTAFAGLDRLDVDAARAALDAAGVSAAGVVAVVDAAMERAVRAVTVEQGVDPREIALVAFGGAGPLHACAVAEALGVRTVIVPARAGCCRPSGWCVHRDRVSSCVRGPTRRHARVSPMRGRSSHAEAAMLVGDGNDPIVVETFVDCRYAGQSHELTVDDVDEFPAEHARRNGFARAGAPIEVVAIRARAARPAPLSLADLPTVARARVVGPRVVAEPDCTVWVPDGWVAEPGPGGAWLLGRESRSVRLAGRAGEPRSGVAPDPDLATRRDRRRDGRGAPACGVQPQHQGACRLLGRGVHRRR